MNGEDERLGLGCIRARVGRKEDPAYLTAGCEHQGRRGRDGETKKKAYC